MVTPGRSRPLADVSRILHLQSDSRDLKNSALIWSGVHPRELGRCTACRLMLPESGWWLSRVSIASARAKNSATDTYVLGPEWPPFSKTISKEECKRGKEQPPSSALCLQARPGLYCAGLHGAREFFQRAINEGFCEQNPFRAVKQKTKYKQRETDDHSLDC